MPCQHPVVQKTKYDAMMYGAVTIEMAKINGIIPAEFTGIGIYVLWPCITRRPHHALGILHRDTPLCLLHEDDRRDDQRRDDSQDHDQNDLVGLQLRPDQAGQARDDAGEDNDRDAVADPVFGDQLAEPDQEHRPGRRGDEELQRGQRGMRVKQPIVLDGAGVREQGALSQRLQHRQRHRDDPRDLVDPLPARFAALAHHLFQAWDHRLQNLDRDLRRDVGVDAQHHDRELPRAAREQAEQLEQIVLRKRLAKAARSNAGTGIAAAMR